MPNLAITYTLHDDAYYLAESIQSFLSAGQVFAFISHGPWHDNPGDFQHAAHVAEQAGATVLLGGWNSELTQRNAAREHLLKRGFTHTLIPDGDEIIEPQLLNTLVTIAEAQLAERVYCHWDTYWKTPQHVIRSREGFNTMVSLVSLLYYCKDGRAWICNHIGLVSTSQQRGRK